MCQKAIKNQKYHQLQDDICKNVNSKSIDLMCKGRQKIIAADRNSEFERQILILNQK